MRSYFTDWPVVQYDVEKSNQFRSALNITSRPILTTLFNAAGLLYYTYRIREGERPDQVAHHYYKDEQLDWVVLMANNIVDPYFQWPMDSASFANYIDKKYGSNQAANQALHHYEWIVTPKGQQYTELNELRIMSEKTLIVDEATYLTLAASSRRLVSAYAFEDALNESHRFIRLLDASFIPALIRRMQLLYPRSE